MVVLMSKQLTDTDISVQLEIPNDCLWVSQLPEGEFSMIFQATDFHGRIWNFQITYPDSWVAKTQLAILHGEWLRFVRERGLNVGDNITLGRIQDIKNGMLQHYITIRNEVFFEPEHEEQPLLRTLYINEENEEILTNVNYSAPLSTGTDYFSCIDIEQGNDRNDNNHPKWKVAEQIFSVANFSVEASTIVFDQLSSTKASVFLPICMGMSYAGLVICIFEFMIPQRWNSNGVSFSTKLILIFCGVGQCILATISYCLFLKNGHNPIQLSVFAGIFAFGQMYHKFCGDFRYRI